MDRQALAENLRQALGQAQDRFVVLVDDSPDNNDEIVQDVLADRGMINICRSADKRSSYSYCVGSAPDVRVGKDWQVFRLMRGGEIHVFDLPESVISKVALPRVRRQRGRKERSLGPPTLWARA